MSWVEVMCPCNEKDFGRRPNNPCHFRQLHVSFEVNEIILNLHMFVVHHSKKLTSKFCLNSHAVKVKGIDCSYSQVLPP
ncbi:hypothetical protein LguiA_029886 [Lonicera macranthoides]